VGWWDRWVWSRVANREALTLEQLLAEEGRPTASGEAVTIESALRLSTVTDSPAAVGRASSASSCSRVSCWRFWTRDQTQRSHQDTAQVRMPVSTTNALGCASCTSARR
jgi:hypothetical protein